MTTEPIEEAYRAHADELTRFATAMVGPDDAGGIVVETMVEVFGRGDLDRVERIRPYLFRAVHHRCLDHLRSQGRRRRRERRVFDEGRTEAEPATPEIEARRALATLSEQQRAVVFFTYWCDDTPATIADVLGVTEGSVRKQLARARARLREVLDA